MSRTIDHLLIGVLLTMTTGFTAATAGENDRKLTIVNPQNLYDPTPNGYSTAVIAPPNARIAYISGQGGQDATGGLSSDFAAQVEQAYANLSAAHEPRRAHPKRICNQVQIGPQREQG